LGLVEIQELLEGKDYRVGLLVLKFQDHLVGLEMLLLQGLLFQQ